MNFNKFHFVLQSNFNPNETIINSKIELIKSYNFKNVTLINSELKEDEYYSLLNTSSVILIPYDMGIYYANTSGIFTEAVSFSKPIIVTNNTWMSDNLCFASGYTFANRNAFDLAVKIEQSANNYNELLFDAKKKSIQWNKYHNATNFLNMLLQINE